MDGTADFTQWLKGHDEELNALGDLARRVESDPRWPDGADVETYREYLEDNGAAPELIDTLSEAWGEFDSVRH
ncbi:YozE family protein [Streptomyces carpinensis]|uniref:YozE family protein n=1 Tax=Streptomyces carpinensis TaxID=66369 RepID=A0ABV1W9J1_9ACTN|nr:YozE family protein [Streptomyces carpinensis]